MRRNRLGRRDGVDRVSVHDSSTAGRELEWKIQLRRFPTGVSNQRRNDEDQDQQNEYQRDTGGDTGKALGPIDADTQELARPLVERAGLVSAINEAWAMTAVAMALALAAIAIAAVRRRRA